VAYKEVRHKLAAIFPYVNVLGGNHLVAITGTMGMLPLWVPSEIEIHKGRSMKWLLEKFLDKEGQSKIKGNKVIANVMAALKTRNATEFSKRHVENIVCKVFHRYTKNKSDGLFFDIVVPGQNLYLVVGNHVEILEGNKRHKTKGSLLPMVPFDGSYIPYQDLWKKIPANWPSWDTRVAGLGARFLKGLFDSKRGDYPNVPFHLNDKITRNHWLSKQFATTETRLLF
jgi:hypothetical protein